MRKSILFLLLGCSATSFSQDKVLSVPAPAPQAKTEIKCDADPKELIKLTAEHDILNDLRARNYTYMQRTETHILNKDGSVKKTETETSEVFVLYGQDVERKIAKDDKPLSEKDAKKEEEKIQKIIDKYKNESESDRNKRLAKYDKDREEGRRFVREVTEAFNFKALPEEDVNGRAACVYEFEPRQGFKPSVKFADKLEKIRGRMWIDKAEQQWSKVDAEVTDTVSYGLFVARLHKGSRFQLDQIKVNDDIWLPKKVGVRIDVRALLFMSANLNVDVAYSDYKKYKTDSRIVVVGEAEEKKEEITPPATPIKKN